MIFGVEIQKVTFQQYYSYIGPTSDYLRYFRRKHCYLPPYPPHLKNVTTLPCKMQNFFIWLQVMLRSSKRWWLWKEPVVMCGNWNVGQATSQQVLKVYDFLLVINTINLPPISHRFRDPVDSSKIAVFGYPSCV